MMRHVGLDMSDDAIRCLEYSGRAPNFKIAKYTSLELPNGLIDGGDIKDEKALGDILQKLDKEYKLLYAKVSIPEEKAYLFQTDISTTDRVAIAQNIEFKLEENVPLPASDAVFYFDILPMSVTGGKLRASVSVVPKVYVEKVVSLLRNAGISPMAFEVVPKSIARTIIPETEDSTVMIVHIMHKKTGVYIVSGGVVCFTSTVTWGSQTGGSIALLTAEMEKIYAYWESHVTKTSRIVRIVIVGNGASKYEGDIGKSIKGTDIVVSVGNVWTNAFSVDSYVPPISKEDSLDYSVSAGLAMDL
ncbi:MAG: pilus assembly protein PilM [Candidatus Paceibacterota bacterium]